MNAIIHTPSSDVKISKAFYDQLSFQRIPDPSNILYTDGKAVIEINPDRFARPGIKLFASSWKKRIEDLRQLRTIHSIPDGYLLTDGNGVWLYLIERKDVPSFQHSENCFSLLGEFSGLSIETTEWERSLQIWKLLGFNVVAGGKEQGYITLVNLDGLEISFMKPNSCPHLFINPSLTYFNGKDNLNIIDRLRKKGIPFKEEITEFNQQGVADNVIIEDPGGYGFFIFGD